MKKATKGQAKTHIRRRAGNEPQPDETPSTSTQPVESRDPTKTQSPLKQHTALQKNLEGQHTQPEIAKHQVAGQHATGSFTGDERDPNRQEHDAAKRSPGGS
jgi:hypothetical protein